MTEMVASILLKAEVGQATAALRSASQAVKDLGGSAGTTATQTAGATRATDQMTGAAARADARLGALGSEAAALRGHLDAMTGAAGRAGAGTVQAGVAAGQMAVAFGQRGAAASVGNLTAQFNDIGMMMAAGQNPLMLAIQQGTQITQVIGPMGAAGAVKSLRAAFVGMISPVSLLTIGTIAARAAMFQWLTGAGTAAATLEERIETLGTSVDDLRKGAANTLTDMEQDFGQVTAAVLAMDAATGALQLKQVLLDAAAAARGVREELEGWVSTPAGEIERLFPDPRGPANQLTTPRQKIAAGRRAPLPAPIIMGLVDELAAAQGIDAQVAAAGRLRIAVADIAGGIEAMNEEQTVFFSSVVGAERALLSAAEALRAFRVAEALRSTETDSGLPRDGGRNAARVADMQVGRAASAEAARMLAVLQQQATINDLIRQYGEQSFEVAVARRAAERAIHAEMVARLNVSAAEKANLIAAWEAAQGLAPAIDLAAAFSALLSADFGPPGTPRSASRALTWPERSRLLPVRLRDLPETSLRHLETGWHFRA